MGTITFNGPVTGDNITVVDENNGRIEVVSNSQKNVNNEDIIQNIIKSNCEGAFVQKCEEADKRFKDMNTEELKALVDEVVDKCLDTKEKKSGFIDRVKQFSYNIANSLVGGLILQVVKNKLFGV